MYANKPESAWRIKSVTRTGSVSNKSSSVTAGTWSYSFTPLFLYIFAENGIASNDGLGNQGPSFVIPGSSAQSVWVTKLEYGSKKSFYVSYTNTQYSIISSGESGWSGTTAYDITILYGALNE